MMSVNILQFVLLWGHILFPFTNSNFLSSCLPVSHILDCCSRNFKRIWNIRPILYAANYDVQQQQKKPYIVKHCLRFARQESVCILDWVAAQMTKPVSKFWNGRPRQCFIFSGLLALHKLLCLGCIVLIYIHLVMFPAAVWKVDL